ncbi:putative holin [Phytopseudomonas dryadis]|uniref:Phage holin n=1 Tax=Phytopseudomonas dryadis TaxID=2487520 RepID=A0A4Q9QY74_9GAMM|nr:MULTISPECIES: putative holin [Pseudomonas]TBU88644.1 hypothetical protein DNK44_18090 [Pseudomonas dryadis]TBV01662.1 hypothetical protein DNK34_20610 [Pseudomonas dryadis]TBV14177.1 hypothetical protein DNK41_20525 [Pseudomonas sp. FRB 230]
MNEFSGTVWLGVLGANLAAPLASIDGEAAIGASLGALVYFTTTQKLPMWHRLAFFLTSAVMGYLCAPAITDFQFYGIRPFAYPGPAGFAGAGLVVTLLLTAIRRRAGTPHDKAPKGRDE